MRISYPRSFLSLLLIGFTIVAVPLVFALFANAVAFEKLAALSEQAVLAAVRVTQASRALTGQVASLERSARQYAVAGEPPFLDAYRVNRATFGATLRALEEMSLSEAQRAESAAIAKMEEEIHGRLARMPASPELSMRLSTDFSLLSSRTLALVSLGDRVIDEGIERLRAQAVKSRSGVFWLLVALIPTAILLIASFTFLIARPIGQVSSGIRQLGDGEFARPIAIEGPGDMVRLGEQLDWLRRRLVTLEEQKTRFLQHMSHELKTPLTALREGSDLLSSGVVGNLNAEQLEIARILRENSIELRKLIEGLLNYSAVHAQASYLDARIVPLRDIVKRVVNDRKLAMLAKSSSHRAQLRKRHGLLRRGKGARDARQPAFQRGQVLARTGSHHGEALQGPQACRLRGRGRRARHPRARAREGLRSLLPRHRRADGGDQGQRTGPVDRQGIRAAAQRGPWRSSTGPARISASASRASAMPGEAVA